MLSNLMKRFFVLLLTFSVLACGDEGILLDEVAPSAPAFSERVTEIPIELQNILWGDRDKLFASLTVAIEADNKERASFLIHRIHIRDRQQEYYTKHINAGGIAIVGDSDMSDWHFEAAREIVMLMTSKHPRLREVLSPDYLHRFQWAQPLIEEGTLTGHRQILVNGHLMCGLASTFVPEARDETKRDGGWCSASKSDYYCVSSVYGGNRPRPMDIFVHEFAHAIDHAMPLFEKPNLTIQDYYSIGWSFFDRHLEQIYQIAHAQGIWKGEYADTNAREYWAEGVQTWFYHIGEGKRFETYAAFSERDPLLAKLLSEWFPAVTLPQQY